MSFEQLYHEMALRKLKDIRNLKMILPKFPLFIYNKSVDFLWASIT